MTLMERKVLVNSSVAHAELIATFQRAQADAAHKLGLIKAAANKGPKAVQAATETAAKAAKRRDSYAKAGQPGGEPQGLMVAEPRARHRPVATGYTWPPETDKC